MLFNHFFGPLDTIYCIYFNILSIYGIIGCTGILVYGVLYPFSINNIFFIFYVFLFCVIYFQNRLLYNMCINNKKNIESIEPIDKYQSNCKGNQRPVAYDCPVCGEKPFCTSTGWMCKTMWTPNNNIPPINDGCITIKS